MKQSVMKRTRLAEFTSAVVISLGVWALPTLAVSQDQVVRQVDDRSQERPDVSDGKEVEWAAERERISAIERKKAGSQPQKGEVVTDEDGALDGDAFTRVTVCTYLKCRETVYDKRTEKPVIVNNRLRSDYARTGRGREIIRVKDEEQRR